MDTDTVREIESTELIIYLYFTACALCWLALAVYQAYELHIIDCK